MHSYTITIAPNDDSGTTTTLVVDTSGNEVRITDVHLHADGGLVGGQMPTVDFGLLLRAVTAPTRPTQIEAEPARVEDASRTDSPAQAEPVGPPVTPPAKASRAPRTRRIATPAAPAPEASPGERVKRTPAATRSSGARKASAKAPKAARTAPSTNKPATVSKAVAGTGERVYRRMPDDFAMVYQQAGTAAAIADHYDVPRHTANGWIRRIRAAASSA